jgi:hypothetical protein
MRVWKRHALTLSVLAGAAVAWSGCSGAKQTEYVTGIATQVQVPRDLKTIRVDVNVGGVPQFCRSYVVYDGRVQLPRSLGQLPQTDSRLTDPITVTIVGFTEDITDPSRSGQFDCSLPVQPGTTARILRRSRQPYVKDQILFLPMALRFSCFDKDCETAGQNMTCKAGRCVDAATDQTRLPKFTDDMVDGLGGACFNATACFAAAGPPAVVNAADCTYALPNTPSAPKVADGLPPNGILTDGNGVNVRIVYDGGYNGEILDNDPDEGFTIPDPAKPQQFRLSPGLCDMVHGYDGGGGPVAHRITAIFASGSCQAKDEFHPLCQSDALQAMGADPKTLISKTANVNVACNPTALKPPPAALMIVSDRTAHSKNFAKDASGADVSLSDPAFEKTDLGLMFFPGDAACNGSQATFTPAVPPANARTTKDTLVAAFASTYNADLLASNDFATKSDMDGALTAAYSLLRTNYPTAYRRAVLLLANHDFDKASCGADLPSKLASDAFANATPVETYVAILTADQDPAQAPAAAGDAVFNAGNILATAGSDPAAPQPLYDARFDKEPARQAFRAIVNDLATCVYDAPAPLLDSQVLSYSDPVTGTTVLIKHAAGCTSAKSTESGWGMEASTGRVVVCGAACTDYRHVLEIASVYPGQYLKPALAVPMFAHLAACAPAEGGKPSGAP